MVLQNPQTIKNFQKSQRLSKESGKVDVQDFSNSLMKNEKKFIDGVIVSVLDGTLLTGLFYQNNVESQHFVEKVNQCFQKRSVKEVIESFQQLSQRQKKEEIRAMYGAGSYSLATTYKSLQVDSTH